MIRIAITAEAFDAIAASRSPPEGQTGSGRQAN
jgi:hypothetical protein